ncbi:MAG: DNA alkylation repair protein [Bacteroidetes bacterium]|nr:DNA alkylation repair protein [Bacteroidota bacterium]
MEPLKEMFGRAFYSKLAESVSTVYKPFHAKQFLTDVCEPLSSLSLNERMRHTSVVLQKYLPSDYQKSIGILNEVIPLMPGGYTNLVFPDYVSQFGTHDFKTSLKALHYFTRFGSSEFAIRTFLKMDFDRTIQEMYRWSQDENEHVRRLSSEGSRPRLPWSFKLDAVIKNPASTQPILDHLKQDESLYVRKSVANHINDFSKDSPDFVLKLIKSWDTSHPHTAWIVKRGCRSLFKQGDKRSLAAFKYTKDVQVSIKNFTITPTSVKIGGAIHFSFELLSQKKSAQRLMVDYRIHYVKKNGSLSPKVFKLTEVDLPGGKSIHLTKKQRFQDFTTRKHAAGKHRLEILVNGEVVKSVTFDVRA